MRIRYLLATIVAGVSASNGFAQATGGTGNTGGNTGGLTQSNANNFQIQQLTEAPQITNTVSAGSVNANNAFSAYYANPLYQGRAGAAIGESPGGFGTAMSGTGGAGGAGRTAGATGANRTGAAAAGGRAATTAISTGGIGATGGVGGGAGGRTGALGGQTNRAGQQGGLGGANAQQQGNAVVQLPRQISYTMTMRMPMPKATPVQIATRMQTDLRSVIDRSSSIANPKGIEVSTDGAVVVLRGRVKDEEEAATAEGIIRLTPGVKGVKNELKY